MPICSTFVNELDNMTKTTFTRHISLKSLAASDLVLNRDPSADVRKCRRWTASPFEGDRPDDKTAQTAGRRDRGAEEKATRRAEDEEMPCGRRVRLRWEKRKG